MKILAVVIGSIAAVVALMWALTANDLAITKVFSPKYEQVRNDTFKHSQAYQDGLAQDLRGFQIAYIKGDASQKASIASVVLHRVANTDINDLPPDLQQFINQLNR